ncbi:UNVERIFIED_CONTAM: hypothetical protein HDU68_011380 [Siphonaria sp. JEL0065]|nr:hypothetical protein HDU68_011380 [Siphonaria sp. JEL0065]
MITIKRNNGIKLTLALDWTPNTNYIGFYTARARGYYAAAGIEVHMLSRHTRPIGPDGDGAALIANGSAQFAISTKESIISLHTRTDGAAPKLVAVASIPQATTHALVSLKSSGIDTPAKMDGKCYYELGGRTQEAAMISRMIQNDGGKGEWKAVSMPNKLNHLDKLLENKVDFLWMYLNCEGIKATRAGHELNVFEFDKYGVPYGFSPVLAVDPAFLESNPKLVQDFLAATERGFQYAAANSEESAKMMFDLVNHKDCVTGPLEEPLDLETLVASCRYMKDKILDKDGRWGRMKEKWWNDLLDWLSENEVLTTSAKDTKFQLVERSTIDSSSLFTNAFLPLE